MFKDFKDYVLLGANGSDKLSEKVREYLAKGYEPFGSPVVSQCYIDGEIRVMMAQAVVLYLG